MKNLQIARDVLMKPLQSVSGVVERRQTLPILSNVLIEAHDGELLVLATDLEIQVSAKSVERSPTPDFSVTVSAKKLLDILRALPDEANLSLELDDSRVRVKAGKSRFNLQTLPAADFPRLSESQTVSAEFSIEQRQLRALLGLTQYAMAQQDIRYYLNGMLFEVANSELVLVATDGHRLSFIRKELPGTYEPLQVILPRKAVIELSRLLGDTDQPVHVALLPNQVKFTIGSIELVTKIIDGTFPPYSRVIPSNYARRIELDRITLQQALHRAAILSNEKFRGVRWILSTGSLKIVCTNTEQEEAEEEIEVAYEGDTLDIGFNITYLMDVLGSVDATRVICEFGDANSSMLLSLEGRDDFKYVVMPMRI